jgi:predicted secreted protein
LTHASKSIAAYALICWSAACFSQQGSLQNPQNVVQLSASAAVDVAQDLMVFSMSTTRDGSDASVVQTQLKLALAAALSEAKKVINPGQLDVKTGQFSLSPRYGREGKINGWQGTVEMVMEGRDFEKISSTAGKIQSFSVAGVSFGLSRELRARVQTDAQAQAIANFKTQAESIAKGFGFSGYTLREITVNANDVGQPFRPRLMAMESRAVMADAPVPVEAGKSTVQVTVGGSVQLK